MPYKDRSLTFCYKGWDFYPTRCLKFCCSLQGHAGLSMSFEITHNLMNRSNFITNHGRSCMSLLNTFDKYVPGINLPILTL